MTVLFKPILALHITHFSSCRNYWGGGKSICLPPNIFMGAQLPQPPPPPRIDASGGGGRLSAQNLCAPLRKPKAPQCPPTEQILATPLCRPTG